MNYCWQIEIRITATGPDEPRGKNGIPPWMVLITVGIIVVGLFVAGLLVGQAISGDPEVVIGVGVKLL